ncbi:hypothetical protein TrRE_jg3846 [Triparma retinervis]|uniref:Peptide-methionine (S)-S-oxide reductase n=1 Tax=Triparma retinervis TaxID=2557542 RepID=A0A9W7CHY2_9STRA|nr:hypothetical protein TrRE_jg3846 [Triparma retinervis]
MFRITTFSALVVLIAGVHASETTYFFGNGCFWHNQHLFTKEFEQARLGRKDGELSSTAVYVAGTNEPSPLCYPSSSGFNNHEEFGSAEAVSIAINDEKEFSLAADIFFGDFQRIAAKTWARRDVYDQGAQFRAVVGVPGGIKGKMGGLLEAANKHNMTLLEGVGSDPDTFEDNSVYVYDTREGGAGTVQEAEICLQYHQDNNDEEYEEEYKALKQMRVEQGTLKDNSCPSPNDYIPGC